MLELPESYTISGQMKRTLTGKIISYIEVLHTPHGFAFFHGDIKSYGDLLEGQTVVDAVCHGGMIEIKGVPCHRAENTGSREWRIAGYPLGCGN